MTPHEADDLVRAAERLEQHGDENVSHFMVYGNLFEVDAKYTPIKPIGKGAYGVVIAIKDIIKPRRKSHFQDVYIVYELMDTDLHQIIRSSQPLSDDHCQYFIYQLLRGLKYIHTANVLHRDLKPSNLLLNANCDLKICDFGLARTMYRAPELLLNCVEYTAAIDVWSVGCIFAELLGRKPLFPGKDYIHQLNLITQVVGSPEEDDMKFIQSDRARRYLKGLPKKKRVPLQTLYPRSAELAIDLIEKMLVFDPSKRVTVEDALAHPYLATLHDVNDEPAAIAPFEFDFENENLGQERVRELIHKEMLEYHPDCRDEDV
eukprot:jgi/Chlat1/2410/Chrsp17S00181